ncbi:MAG: radical SAM protein [Anaerolineae bacterium]
MTERGYPRYLEEGFEPYDPVELIRRTETIVSRGTSRKYTSFYCTGVYGGISTGYTVGCCLRCAFCWVDWSRDFPEKYGQFYTPEGVFQHLVANARKKRVAKLRISGGEPTLVRAHLLSLLDLVEATDYLFILETNGLPLAADETYARELAQYSRIHVRVSLKAGSAQGFQARTGAQGQFWELPFLAIQRLMEAGVSFHVAAMSDPRLMPPAERREMIRRLRGIGYRDYLEEERCDPYPTSVARLGAAGFRIFEEGDGS